MKEKCKLIRKQLSDQYLAWNENRNKNDYTNSWVANRPNMQKWVIYAGEQSVGDFEWIIYGNESTTVWTIN